MKSCTFFGHRDTPEEICEVLTRVIIELIEKEDVKTFFVGNQGKFDYMVRMNLRELSKIYPIKYFVVLAYLPQKKDFTNEIENTVFPDGIEKVPRRFSIDWRNRWMLKNSEYVIVYINRIYGGASKFCELAEKMNKNIINLAKK